MHVGVLLECTPVHNICAEPGRPEEGIGDPGTACQMVVSCHLWVLDATWVLGIGVTGKSVSEHG